MSIWEKCEEHNAVPFFGFPLKVSFKNGSIVWEFPEGYTPNGDQTKEVAEKLRELTGGDILEVTDKLIRILPCGKHLAVMVYQRFIDSNIMFKRK